MERQPLDEYQQELINRRFLLLHKCHWSRTFNFWIWSFFGAKKRNKISLNLLLFGICLQLFLRSFANVECGHIWISCTYHGNSAIHDPAQCSSLARVELASSAPYETHTPVDFDSRLLGKRKSKAHVWSKVAAALSMLQVRAFGISLDFSVPRADLSCERERESKTSLFTTNSVWRLRVGVCIHEGCCRVPCHFFASRVLHGRFDVNKK